jgi:phospholipid/cholesterol/gamma-HCH transport system substrate-binding protein
MKEAKLEFIVGMFMILGLAGFGYMTTQFGEVSFFGGGSFYSLSAEFNNVTGLKSGADVAMAGVPVGRVSSIGLTKNDRAKVSFLMRKDIRITDDAIASIKTQGLIGDKFIKISQGGSDKILAPGDVLFETESALDIEELVSQFIFGQV